MKNVWDKSPVTLNHFKPLQFSVGISSSKKDWTLALQSQNIDVILLPPEHVHVNQSLKSISHSKTSLITLIDVGKC